MSPEKRAAIARKGGQSVPNEKRAFSVDRKLAETAGAKGGTNGTGRTKARCGTGRGR